MRDGRWKGCIVDFFLSVGRGDYISDGAKDETGEGLLLHIQPRSYSVESLEDSLLNQQEEHHCTDQVIVYHQEKYVLH